MQFVQFVFAELQIQVHRLQEPLDRLFQVRRLLRLRGRLQEIRYFLFSRIRKKGRRKTRGSGNGGASGGRARGIFHGEERTAGAFKKGAQGIFLDAFYARGGSRRGRRRDDESGRGLAPIRARRRPERAFKISPPGSGGIANIADKCTACPSRVLVPSRSLSGFMQPEMTYENGYCRIEYVECSKVCPAGAILPIFPEEKASTQIGRAVWTASRCIVNTDGMQCDNCFRQCPTGAIQMVAKDPKDPKSLKIPTVDVARCIGCGACENLCPARPVAAICVEGNPSHNSI